MTRTAPPDTQPALFDPETIGQLADAITERLLPQLVTTVRAEAVDALAGETVHLPTRATLERYTDQVATAQDAVENLQETASQLRDQVTHLPEAEAVSDQTAELRLLREAVDELRQVIETAAGIWTPSGAQGVA